MESPEELSEAIKLYESQLEQVNTAISTTGATEELISLKANISELLELTRESLEALKPNENVEEEGDDAFAKEYAMFKAELESLEKTDNVENGTSNSSLPCGNIEENESIDIQEELEELVGSKCQAPYTNKLGVIDYYNALVFSTHVPDTATDVTQIEVRVMFTNPVEKEMLPCPYYLDGKCKFTDGKCNFSHGYLSLFSQLKEYKEPEFSGIRRGSHILAKPPGSQLWLSTRVDDVLSDDVVSVKYHGVPVQVPLHDVFPLNKYHSTGEGEVDVDSDEEEEDAVREFGVISEEAVERSLSDPTGACRKFGEWEQHTKGIGSKLMAKMGYVVGAGLGKSGEGRIEPVQAVILPPGKSLDHCMGLREAAGGCKDLFSVERLQKKLAVKAQRKSAAAYRKKKHEEQHNVFNIINDMAAVTKKENEDEFSSRSFKRRLESWSERTLNVEKLKTEETMERMSRDIYILSDKLSMKKEGSTEYNNIAAKLTLAREEFETLERKNGKIAWEINMRDTKKKMAF